MENPKQSSELYQASLEKKLQEYESALAEMNKVCMQKDANIMSLKQELADAVEDLKQAAVRETVLRVTAMDYAELRAAIGCSEKQSHGDVYRAAKELSQADKNIVVFWGDEVPTFRVGEPTHELEERLTIEHVEKFVERISFLSAKAKITLHEKLAVLGQSIELSTAEEIKEACDLIIAAESFSEPEVDLIIQAYRYGPLFAGDVSSRRNTSSLIDKGFLVRVVCQGRDSYIGCSHRGAWAYRILTIGDVDAKRTQPE